MEEDRAYYKTIEIQTILGVGRNTLYDISNASRYSDTKIISDIYTHMFDKINNKAISKIADAFKK